MVSSNKAGRIRSARALTAHTTSVIVLTDLRPAFLFQRFAYANGSGSEQFGEKSAAY
jgi:hypothetical protein